MNQLVPFDEDTSNNRAGSGESQLETEVPGEMQQMMEEMESVLYSISFGKQEQVARTKY